MAKFTGLFDAEYEHKKEPHQQKTNHARFMMLKNKEKHGKQTIHGKRRKQINKDDVLPRMELDWTFRPCKCVPFDLIETKS